MRRTLLLICLTACATTRSSQLPYITLEHDSGTSWRATYHLRTPARELRFQRFAAGIRTKIFEVLTPGYSIKREGQTDILSTTGDAAREIVLRFPEYTQELPKEYEFFEKFTDGSVAIYTGHLLADAGGEKIRRFRFVSRPDEHIVVGGKRRPTPVDWVDATGEGTYVYFGSIAPVETAYAISIIDPGLPEWLGAKSRDAMPRLFALYTQRLGAKLPDRPAVLFNYVRGEKSGLSSGGGTLPGLIQLRVEGREWERESDDGLRHLFHFLAHEAAHLWNGQIINYPGTEHSWMHEGGADALAERAMLDLGVIDKQAFLGDQTAALNECLRNIGAGPLREAASRNDFGLYYSCGNVIALFTDAAVPADLFSFWNALIARVVATPDKKYGVDDYVAVWRHLGATPSDVATLQSIVNDRIDADKITAALREKGVQIVESDDVPQPFGQSLSRSGLMRLLRENCTAPYGFKSTPRGFLLDEPMDCRDFPPGKLVKEIGGQDVIKRGQRAWDALHAACGTGGSISVRLESGEITVPCSAAVPARPSYVRIVNVQ